MSDVKTSPIEELASNVLDTNFASFDQKTVESAKDLIIDTVGCLVTGANATGNRELVDLVKDWGGKKEATILVHRGKVPAHNAAMVNSIMARSLDYEATDIPMGEQLVPSHIAGTTIPTALTMAEKMRAGGKELITASIIGSDIAARMIVASDYSIDSHWDCTGTANKFGATAIAGRFLGLNKKQMLNAFGIVLNQLAGTFQSVYDGVHCFKLHQGLSARDGIISAELARKGWTGVRDPLLSEHGYFPVYCQTYHPELLTKELGTKFYADGTFKPYPCCRNNHGAIDCALELLSKHDIRTDDIEEIVVNVTPTISDTFAGRPFEIRELPEVDATFNMRYNVANVLLRKNVTLEHFTEEFVRDSKVLNLAKKVKVTGTLPSDKLLAAELKVKMKDGGEFFAHVDAPKADPIYAPATRSEIRRKFEDNMASSKAVTKGNAKKALEMFETLEATDDVTEIIKLL